MAFEACGSDYANYACMCPKQHANVICLVTDQVSAGTKIPSWLQQRHCPGDDDGVSTQNVNGFTSYQQFLYNAADSACQLRLKSFLDAVN